MNVQAATFSGTSKKGLESGGNAAMDAESMRRLQIDTPDGSQTFVVKTAPKPLNPTKAEVGTSINLPHAFCHTKRSACMCV
jgi:hypothetical protein